MALKLIERGGTMSDKKYQTYMFLVNYIKENGFPPSYREIAEGIGVDSIATVMYRLRNLEMMGKIEVWKDKSHAIRVIEFKFVKPGGRKAKKRYL